MTSVAGVVAVGRGRMPRRSAERIERLPQRESSGEKIALLDQTGLHLRAVRGSRLHRHIQ
jgi:hypothetical protein